MESRPRRSRPFTALALMIAGAIGCGGDPRIIATFRQGTAPVGYTSQQAGAFYYYNPPTVADGHVYIGTSRNLFEDPRADNFFFKLDADLHKVWEVALGKDEVRGGAAVGADGRIYFVVEKGRVAGESMPVTDFLYCLDRDGKLLWEYQLDSGSGGMINPAIASDGTIYVGGEKLHALHPDGTLRWAYPPGSETLYVYNAPIIDPAGNVYFSASHKVHSLAPDGAPRWSYPNEGAFLETLSSPAFSFDHSRVYAALGHTMNCLDAATGTLHWSVAAGLGNFRATPAVDDRGNVYAGTKAHRDSAFYAIGADGGFASEGVAIGLYFTPAIAIKTGPVFFRDRAYYERLGIGSWVWSVQLDVDVDLTRARARGSATEAAHPAPGAAAAPETGPAQTVTPP